MTENFDPSSFNYDGVEANQEFTAAKAGVYQLNTDEAKAEKDEKGRLYINIRHSFVNPAEVERVGEGLVGGIFNKLWLHTEGCFKISMQKLRNLVEASGADWAAFAAGIKAGTGQPLETVLTGLLESFNGTQLTAKIALVTHYEDKSGAMVELQRPRNEIVRYVVPKTATK